jgi:fluoride exporter
MIPGRMSPDRMSPRNPSSPRSPGSLRVWLAVAGGGLAGTEARYFLGLAAPDSPSGVPWTTLAVNVLGSLVLGFLTTWWAVRPGTPFWLRAALGPGLLGSFTTFSAVALSVNMLAAGGRHPAWLLYLGLSLLLGLAAAAGGLALGRRLGGPRPVRQAARSSGSTP